MSRHARISQAIEPLEPVEFEDMEDTAQGAKVPRCGACGVPGPVDLVGERGGLAGRFPLCSACWRRHNPAVPE